MFLEENDMSLTDLEVKNARPQERPFKLNDGKGLFLHISPPGKKTWRYRYKITGKESVVVIGEYPDMTLLSARVEGEAMRRKVKAGVNPSKERQAVKQAAVQEKEKEVQAAINSFQNITYEWHEREKGSWSVGHSMAVMETLRADVFPAIGAIAVDRITPPMIMDILRAIEAREALVVAQKVLQRMTAVFRYAVQTGRAHYNPATEMKGVIKKRAVQHHPMITAEELPAFLHHLMGADLHVTTKLALEFAILTAARTGEVRGATWSEIDLEKGIWSIPGERMKMKMAHAVPLSRQAAAILSRMKILFGDTGIIFPGVRAIEKKPLSENTLLYAMYRMGYHGRATVHGFRAAFSIIANEAGFNPDAIERQLAHREKNQVRAAYHRSEYMAERVEMMQWWADHLEALRNDCR
jgi:integrase